MSLASHEQAASGTSRRRIRVAAGYLIVLLLGSAWPAAALPAGGPAAVEHASACVVTLALHGDPVPEERLRAAIAAELRCEVVPSENAGNVSARGAATVTYHRATGELAVSWDDANRGTVTRVVAAPDSAEALVRQSALLLGNLARNEANELAREPELPPAPPHAEMVVIVPASDERAPKIPVTASVFYPLATHYGHPAAESNFNLNLVYGRIGLFSETFELETTMTLRRGVSGTSCNGFSAIRRPPNRRRASGFGVGPTTRPSETKARR